MNGHGESDGAIVPMTHMNNMSGEEPQVTEYAEGRAPAKGKPPDANQDRTRSRANLDAILKRIRQAAVKDKQQRFTALWHHVYDVARLRYEYYQLRPDAAPGIDEVSWQAYGEKLEERLQGLSARLKRGAYRAPPVRRTYIPKGDGRQRPIGIPTLEDKIVQRATAAVMQPVYETDFMGFSYGFRPKRSAHQALDALAMGITTRKVNWVVDADIRSFFDTMDHNWVMKFVAHRIADKRVLRQIQAWLKAGIMEKGHLVEGHEGTPQGGSISPLLANVYLHYAFDMWIGQWRKTCARGDVVVVRYADDFVVGFQYREEAEKFLNELRERFRKFNLELHAEKTRVIEFGRYAIERRRSRDESKPETFNFLGFTHICAKTKKAGKFIVYRCPMARRRRAKLLEIKTTLLRNRHRPIAEMGEWLRSVLEGWYQYYAVPLTYPIMAAFRRRICWLWYRALRRRSQRNRVNWAYMYKLVNRWLPRPNVVHPYPWKRFVVTT